MHTTRFFLDGGDPNETQEAINLLGKLDGQTTNPSLVAKNPDIAAVLKSGKKLSLDELLGEYKRIVTEVSNLLPTGSVSIEVYADQNSTAPQMFAQACEMYTWIPNAHIKFPTNAAGLEAAQLAVKENMRVNMTLCFTQTQAAAVYAATRNSQQEIFVSPFIGRLDDIGQNGLDLITNIKKMFDASDGHVKVLAASIRNTQHLRQCLEIGADIVTCPLPVYKDWKQSLSVNNVQADSLAPIAYQEIDLSQEWRAYNIEHELTTAGIAKFAQDWNNLLVQQ